MLTQFSVLVCLESKADSALKFLPHTSVGQQRLAH
jgi:hypothetical protein